MLNKSGKNGHPSLFPDLRVSLLSMMPAVMLLSSLSIK